jgi:hypothetical protein
LYVSLFFVSPCHGSGRVFWPPAKHARLTPPSRPSITTTDTSSSTTSFVTNTSASDRSNRDSFVSIVDDPFFLYYDANTYDASLDGDPSETEPGSLHRQQVHQQHKGHHRRQSSQAHSQNLKAGSDERTGSSSWPIPRRESLTIGPSPYLVRLFITRKYFTSLHQPRPPHTQRQLASPVPH